MAENHDDAAEESPAPKPKCALEGAGHHLAVAELVLWGAAERIDDPAKLERVASARRLIRLAMATLWSPRQSWG